MGGNGDRIAILVMEYLFSYFFERLACVKPLGKVLAPLSRMRGGERVCEVVS